MRSSPDRQPKASVTPYAAEPVRTGTASTPEPISPMAKRSTAASPASGRRAWAASVAEATSVLPATNRVAPVARMMK